VLLTAGDPALALAVVAVVGVWESVGLGSKRELSLWFRSTLDMECGRRLGRSSRRGRGRGFTNIADIVARKLVLVLLLISSYFDLIRR
jgi:hypothetical protein